ncbi:hypothetical protein OAX78_00335 [Planctomycetota bacterium]|nr:hypothetical protein [Planctomycetota bacterium]
MSLSLKLAVEKVLYRLALSENGAVPIARAFLELPLCLEELEEYADEVADGTSVVKNEWTEFLTYDFPELMDQDLTAPDDCPACGGEPPPVITEAGAEVRRSLICDACYREVRVLCSKPDPGTIGRLKRFFVDEQVEDPVKIAEIEHEVFYLGLQRDPPRFTHTTVAAQSRLPASQLKDRLDKMAARRYIHVGLLPSGDAVAYRLPPDLSYPKPHYDRLRRSVSGRLPRDKKPAGKSLINFRKKEDAPVEPPKPSGLKIVIKDRRDRR